MSAASRAAELPRQAATAADEQIGLNAAIAAALTRAVGSMRALYVVLVIVGGWMALATWGPLHGLDPYPFAFLLFLDNVVQLVLCLVILVGQRVLGMAADRMAVQTYESAEAIFAQIADLQEHLNRHDQALSRGLSLLESRPHPWTERHRVQPPPQALDHAVDVNGRIAAWLTRRLGSMWAFYAAAVTQVVWMGMAAVGVQHFDPYPFAFMTFLSTLTQLIFMVVIMVGQGVLGRAADRRSEQTFLNAEAILFECRRMKVRLTAQDRLIDSLSGYSSSEIIEDLARAIYAGADPSLPWHELPQEPKESARAQARQIGEQLAAVSCVMVPAFDFAPAFEFGEEEVEVLARLEHERRLAERRVQGPEGRTRPGLVPWDELPGQERAKKLHAAWKIPGMLAAVGLQVVRDETAQDDGATEADFTAEEWAMLQRALMASGVLVAISEGVVDSEEMYELIKTMRQARITHPRRFIRQLAAASTFETGLQPDTTFADYETPALETIRSATAIVADKAPVELNDFRAFLVEIATVVADANQEGGFFGIGAQARTPNEAAAMDAVRRATGHEG